MTHYGDLNVGKGNNGVLTIKGTLVITGNFEVGGQGKVVVEAGARLLVFGTYLSNGNTEVANSGLIVVKGEFTANGSTTVTTGNPGEMFIYDDTPQLKDANMPRESEQILLQKYPDIYRFMSQDPSRGRISPLPVELLYFRSTTTNQGIQLEWASAKEWNFSHYTVERSEDGKSFTPIYTEHVSGDSYSTKTYAFLDKQPHFGANYYRLKATDIDESVEYKGMAMAYSGTRGDIQVYPNPAKGGVITVKNPGALEGTWLSITGTTGNELMRIQMPERELQLPSTALPSGIYIVKVWNHLEVKQARLVIQ
ncbi:hypothetical protein D770_21705 [Flammeovirgaceae bacterium 311]|nr:hypothetical protein D770_21705 [Flammeovirgaceae bacterium 311]